MNEARKERSKERLKASPPPPALARLPWKYIIKVISSCGQGTFGGHFHVTIRATREFAFSGGDFPTTPADLAWDAERRPRRGKSGDEKARNPTGGPAAREGRRSVSWVSAVAGPFPEG